MSDYCRKKALRVPVEDTGFNVGEHGIGWYDKLDEFIKSANGNFEISPTDRVFVDYDIPTRGHAEGEWGKCRPLTDAEKVKYGPTFAKIGVTDMDKVRLVEYCWYNCSEAPDYYYNVYSDDFYKEV